MKFMRIFVWAGVVALVTAALFTASRTVVIAEDAPVAESEAAERPAIDPMDKNELYRQLELFADALSLVRDEYVEPVEPKTLIYGALEGMCASLDNFSSFMTPDEYDEIKLETRGEFGGVGIEIGIRDGILTVIAPIADTPAARAGIRAGDKIVKIDGEITKSLGLDEAVKQMRGEPGTKVVFTIWREKDNEIFDVPLVRALIKIKSIKEATFVEGRIGYVKLAEFQEHTPEDLDAALTKLGDGGMNALILDLRNNPGGLLDTAVDVAERFLEANDGIVSITSREPGQDVTFKSSGRHAHLGFPMVVIVNQGSASASEIVAGAVQDNKRGIVLGEKTFGKASVQTVIPLKDGSAVRLTTASYLTPSGKLIREEGIIPDVVVEKETDGKKRVDIFERLEGKEVPPEEPAGEEAVVTEEAPPEPAEAGEADEAADDDKKQDEEKDNQLEAAINVVKGIQAYAGEETKKDKDEKVSPAAAVE